MIDLRREITGDLESAVRREWLVRNGFGGFASGTVAGMNTRRYRELLFALYRRRWVARWCWPGSTSRSPSMGAYIR